MGTIKPQPGAGIDPLPIHPIDAHIGQRIRARRLFVKLSEAAVAARLGITVETLEAFEEGRLRARATDLYVLSMTLDVPVRFFFQDYTGEA